VTGYRREGMREPRLVAEDQQGKEPSIRTWDALAEILRRRGKVAVFLVPGRPPLDVVVVLLRRNAIQSRTYARLRAITGEASEHVEASRKGWIETWIREDAESQYFENLELLFNLVKQ
jgi:hypothetical protein